MYLGRFQTFGECQWRENAWKTFSHHRFATSGCTYHDEVMTSGCGDFECSFYAFLSLYIGKIERKIGLAPVKFFTGIHKSGFQGTVAVEELNDFGDIFYAKNFQVVDDCCFTGILFGKNQSLQSLLAGTDSNGKCSFDGL